MSPQEQLQMLANGNFVSISQAAKSTPYTAEYLSLLARKGRLRAVKINRDWITTPEAVSEYLQRQAVKHRKISENFQNLANRQAGFAGIKLLIMLGLAIVGVSGFLAYSVANKVYADKSEPAAGAGPQAQISEPGLLNFFTDPSGGWFARNYFASGQMPITQAGQPAVHKLFSLAIPSLKNKIVLGFNSFTGQLKTLPRAWSGFAAFYGPPAQKFGQIQIASLRKQGGQLADFAGATKQTFADINSGLGDEYLITQNSFSAQINQLAAVTVKTDDLSAKALATADKSARYIWGQTAEFSSLFAGQTNEAMTRLGFNILDDSESAKDLALRAGGQINLLAQNFASDVKAPYVAAADVIRPAVIEQKDQTVAIVRAADESARYTWSGIIRPALYEQKNELVAEGGKINQSYYQTLLSFGQAGIESLDEVSVWEARQANRVEAVAVSAQITFANFYNHAGDVGLALEDPVQSLHKKINEKLLALGQFIIGQQDEGILPDMTHEKFLAMAKTTPSFAKTTEGKPSSQGGEVVGVNQGKVLAASTVAPVSLSRQIKDILYGYIQQGLFGFNASNYAPDGILHVGGINPSAISQPAQSYGGQTYSGPNGSVQNGNGQTTSVIGGTPIVSYYPSAPSQNFTGGSVAGFTDLSANNFNVGNNTSLNNLNVTGNSSLNSLTVNGNTNLAGTTTIANASITNLTVTGTISTSTISNLILANPLSLTSGGLGFDASLIQKGGLITGTGSGTLGILASGANGLCLLASSTAPSGMVWNSCALAANAITSLNGQTNPVQNLIAGSDANIGLSITSLGGTHTFTPTWSGQLSVARGGTGLSNVPNGYLLIGSSISTSSLATIATGSAGSVLTMIGNIPTWGTTTTLATGLGAFVQGGNAFGAPAILGTNDNQPLQFVTNSTPKMTILANGNVGIGTTNPGTPFQVTSSGIGQMTGILIHNSQGGANSTANIGFAITTSASPGETARVSAIRTNAVNNFDTDLAFSTQVAGSLTEKMRILSNGNVGIGTTSPAKKLEVAGTVRSALYGGSDYVIDLNPTTGSIDFGNNTVTNNFLSIGAYSSKNNIDNKSRDFQIFGNGISGIMLKATTGNVGIGTTGPSGPLEVNDTTSNFNRSLTIRGHVSSISNASIKFSIDGTDYVSWATAAAVGQYGTANIGDSIMRTESNSNVISLFNGNNFGKGMNLYNNNIGIGTAAPGAKLQVAGSNVSDTPQGDILMSRYWGSVIDSRASAIFHYFDSVQSKDMLVFGVSGNGGTNLTPNQIGQAKMVIQANGNVGIGTTSPSAKLEVAGAGTLLQLTGSSSVGMNFSGTEGNVRDFSFLSGSSARWILRTDSTAESGSNVGSDFNIIGRADDGSSLGTYLFIKRSNGDVLVGSGTDNGGGAKLQVTGGLTTTGNVGIGTTSPTNAKLELQQANDTSGFRLWGSTVPTSYFDFFINNLGNPRFSTNGTMVFQSTGLNVFQGSGFNVRGPDQSTSLFYVQSNSNTGNVGIGTTAPTASLHILTTNKDATQIIKSSVVNTTSASLLVQNSGTAGITLISSGTGVGGTSFGVTNGGNDFIKGGRSLIVGVTTANPLIFGTNNAEQMRIDSNGNVGIGTTSPAGALDVYGNVYLGHDVSGVYFQNGSVWSQNNALQFLGTGSSGVWFGSAINSPTMVIKSGNVGIGTTSPTTALTLGSGQITVPNGSNSAPSYAFSNYTNSGLYSIGGAVVLTSNGVQAASFDSNGNKSAGYGILNVTNSLPGGVLLGPTGRFGWTNGVSINAPDTAISRIATSTMAVGNGTQGDFTGTLIAGNVGIGTTSPNQMLSVGSIANPGNAKIAKGWLCVDNNDTCTGAATAGTIYTVNVDVQGADVAEKYPTKDTTLEAGDVVMADAGFPIYVKKANLTPTLPSQGEAAPAILGIVSTKPGLLLNGYKSEEFTNASTVPVALNGRVPVKVTNENGSINIGDYLAPSKQFPGYAMKATSAGFALGRALENFTASSTSATPNLGSVLIFLQPIQYAPKVADLLQVGINSDNLAWLQSLAGLNMTNASVFGDIAVAGSLAVQKDLHVGGIIYGASLNVDNLTVNRKLCIGQTCVTEDQLKKLLEISAQQTSAPSVPASPAAPAPPALDASATPAVLGTTTPPAAVPPEITPPPPPIVLPATPAIPPVEPPAAAPAPTQAPDPAKAPAPSPSTGPVSSAQTPPPTVPAPAPVAANP